MEPDHYAALGVAPGAGADEVRRAYRAAALRLHPDKAGGAEGGEGGAAFAAAQGAWAALGEPTARAAYDRRRAVAAAHADVAVSDEVALEDAEAARVELEGGAAAPAFSWPCRCGGRYALPEADASGEVVLPCASCSLHIGVRCPAAGARLADYGLEAPLEGDPSV
jgi:curved DNA-binding protein CbpA